MLLLFVSFLLVAFAVDAKGWGKRLGLFALSFVLFVAGGLLVLSDNPSVIQWVLAWITR